MRSLIDAMQALRGVAKLTVVTIVAELGTFSRFTHPLTRRLRDVATGEGTMQARLQSANLQGGNSAPSAHAAIGDDNRSRHVRRKIRRQKQYDISDLFWTANPPHRYCRPDRFRIAGIAQHRVKQWRVDRARANAVGTNAVGCVFKSSRAREALGQLRQHRG
jgi:hypothetical protein